MSDLSNINVPDFKDPEASMWNYFIELMGIIVFKSYVLGGELPSIEDTRVAYTDKFISMWRDDLRVKFELEVNKILAITDNDHKIQIGSNPIVVEMQEAFDKSVNAVEIYIREILK